MRIKVMTIITLIVMLTGCFYTIEKPRDKNIIKMEENQQVQDLPFENGNGHVTLIFETYVDCIVYANGLKTEEEYQIHLIAADGKNVIFGPEQNVKVRVGKIFSEVNFKTNQKGELYVSMMNAISMFSDKEIYFVIKTKDGKEVMKTVGLVVNNRVM